MILAYLFHYLLDKGKRSWLKIVYHFGQIEWFERNFTIDVIRKIS